MIQYKGILIKIKKSVKVVISLLIVPQGFYSIIVCKLFSGLIKMKSNFLGRNMQKYVTCLINYHINKQFW